MKRFYVYYYLRPDGSPYYVGKGSGNRVSVSSRRGCQKPSDEYITIVKDDLTEEESFGLEMTLIKFWGRKDNGTGILRNLTDGGEGCSGMVHSEETRRVISEKRQKQVFSSEVIERRNQSISESRRGVVVPYENKEKVRGRYLYTFVNDDGREETTDLLPEFCRRHNLIESNLYKVVRGSRNHCGGWRLRR